VELLLRLVEAADYIYSCNRQFKDEQKYYQSTSLSCSPTKLTVEGENLTGDDGPQLRTM
jgi:hypothetical protein